MAVVLRAAVRELRPRVVDGAGDEVAGAARCSLDILATVCERELREVRGAALRDREVDDEEMLMRLSNDALRPRVVNGSKSSMGGGTGEAVGDA